MKRTKNWMMGSEKNKELNIGQGKEQRIEYWETERTEHWILGKEKNKEFNICWEQEPRI